MPDIKTAIARFDRFLERLPAIVADEIIDWVLDNFDGESYEGSPWPDRKDGDRSRALLVKSGRGRRSIRVTERTKTKVVVGTDLDYMIAHNDGAEITRQITPRMRKFFWAMHYKFEQGRDEGDIMWKWLALKKGPITFKMPQRQFFGPSEELDQRLTEAIEFELNKVFS